MLPGVSKTAVLTLRARAEEHARADRVFADPLAAEWYTRVTWPPELDAWYSADAQYPIAFRADDVDHILWGYASPLPALTVVELGCGLSTRRSRIGEHLPLERWIDVDLPEVIALRRSWGDAGDRHHLVARSVLDRRWMDEVTGDPASLVFLAEGLLYYLPRAEVDQLLLELRSRFPGAVLLLDVLGANDYPTLLRNTTAVGSPVTWKLEADFDDVLGDLGLCVVPGLEPDRLMADALARYWPRFDAKLRGAIYWARSNPLVWRGRSGMVLGRLASP